MHSACQIGKCRNWASFPARAVRTCRVKLMYDSSAFRMKLFERADPTENTRPAQSIVSYSPVPRCFDFNTFNARVINGSMPFSISVFLLSSLISTGMPLPS